MSRLRSSFAPLVATPRRAWLRLPPRVRRVAPLVLVLIAGIWLGNVLFGERHQHPSDAEIVASDSAVEVWTCSMHPQIRQPEPGNCPICGMSLIPVQGGGHDHGSLTQVSISQNAAALMAVQVRPVERRAVAGQTTLSGRIDYDERLVHDVVLRTEGQVERLYVNFTNAPVGRGQRLAEIYSPAILSASQELLQAQRAAQRSGMAELVEAARTQLLLLGVSEEQIEQILSSGQPARTYTLFSPAGGVVTDLTARQGEWLGSGARLMRVGGLGQVWAQFEAYESDLGRLRTGQEVRFTVESFPGQRFQGPITFIDPVVDGARRTARVRVQVPNPGGRLMPGMLARGLVTGQGSPDTPLIIPASAPLLTGTRAVVYVQLPNTDRPTFEPRDVTLGARTGDFFEVTHGLEEGELVVVHGAFRLDSELQIRGGPSMMSPEGTRPVALPDQPAERAGEVPLGDVIAAYLRLTDALVDSDAVAARDAAVRMDRVLRGIDPGSARGWGPLRGRMTSALATMQRGNAGLEEVRAGLPALSEALEEAATAFGADTGSLHRAYCPMAFDFEGAAWLQRDQTIANPYFGDSMLRCGEIQETVG
jgi:membrane fusion protein, copper/silver efflux system